MSYVYIVGFSLPYIMQE